MQLTDFKHITTYSKTKIHLAIIKSRKKTLIDSLLQTALYRF